MAAWPVVARGQQGTRVRRVGILYGGTQGGPIPRRVSRHSATRSGKYGWVSGTNVQFVSRFHAPANQESISTEARALVDLEPDVHPQQRQRLNRRPSWPNPEHSDRLRQRDGPGEQRTRSELGHPGGNITGFTNLEFPIAGKWLQILKELAPISERF